MSIALHISRLLLRLFVSVSRVEEEYDDYGGIDYIAIVDVVDHEMTWQFPTNNFNNSPAFPEEIPEQQFLSILGNVLTIPDHFRSLFILERGKSTN